MVLIYIWPAGHVGKSPWPMSMLHMFWYQFR